MIGGSNVLTCSGNGEWPGRKHVDDEHKEKVEIIIDCYLSMHKSIDIKCTLFGLQKSTKHIPWLMCGHY